MPVGINFLQKFAKFSILDTIKEYTILFLLLPMDTHLNQQENIVPATHVPPVTSEELLESLQESSEYKRDIYRLSEVYQELFGTEYLGNYCCYAGGRQECSDGADLYTLIKYQGKDLIVKV